MDTEMLQILRCIGLKEMGMGPFTDSRRMKPSEKSRLVALIKSKIETQTSEEIIADFNILVSENIFYNGAPTHQYPVSS